jgi:hypothetical protein
MIINRNSCQKMDMEIKAYFISTFVSSFFVGVFFGTPIRKTPFSIFASIPEGTISSGVEICLLRELYDLSLYK